MPHLIKVENLKKEFPVRRSLFRQPTASIHALSGVDFTLNRGEVLGVVGESGCGKSTLGKCLLRLEEPTEGSIEMSGQDIRALTKHQLRRWRKKAQMIFQNPHASLNPRKTVGKSIGGGVKFHPVGDEGWVAHMLEQVGLSPDIARRYPHEFSGGQQQRICLARALALQPELLICDEVVSALDVSVQAQILNLLQELKERFSMSYLFISHDLGVVSYLCDRVMVLYLGKVCEEGPIDQVFANPKHPYTQMLLSAVPKTHPRKEARRLPMIGEPPSSINPPKGCPFHPRCPKGEKRCQEAPPPWKEEGTHRFRCIW